MNNTERDKLLTEAMGFEIWDEIKRPKLFLVGPLNFSTWECFGKLFEFCQKQEWWRTFSRHKLFETSPNFVIPELIINPDNFANAVYEFLKEKEK